MEEKHIKNLIEEYELKREKYKEYVSQLKSILEGILKAEGIKFLFVEGRAKTPESLKGKLEASDKHVKSLADVQDLAGIRIVTYVYSDVEKIERILPKNFTAQEVERVEKRLGVDKVGYRSHHWTIALSDQRLVLPEYREFGEYIAELQVSTVLQHAWAQLEHDQVYKPSAVLPDDIKRNFKLLSGLLEVADNEFERISLKVSEYEAGIDRKVQKDDLNIPINSITLRRYLDSRFKATPRVQRVFGPSNALREKIIEELRLSGITTLKQLDTLIPPDYEEECTKIKEYNNYAGLMRDIMLIHDAKKYFERAWRGEWQGMSRETMTLLQRYGVDEKIIISHVTINV